MHPSSSPNAQAYRKERLDAGQSKVSLNDVIAYAIVKSLGEHAELNAHFLGDRIATFEKVHLGVAVDTDRGLLVPVIKDASDLSIEQISSEVKKLAGALPGRNHISRQPDRRIIYSDQPGYARGGNIYPCA